MDLSYKEQSMKLPMVRSKIHRATVTGGDLNYEGSIMVGRNMLTAVGLIPFQLVHVNNVNSAAHWETYVIPGDDGVIVLNGSPARLFMKGDIIVIMGIVEISTSELHDFTQVVAFVNDKNEVIHTECKLLRDQLQ